MTLFDSVALFSVALYGWIVVRELERKYHAFLERQRKQGLLAVVNPPTEELAAIYREIDAECGIVDEEIRTTPPPEPYTIAMNTFSETFAHGIFAGCGTPTTVYVRGDPVARSVEF